MISIARTLGAPLTVPAGKRGAQHVDRRLAVDQLAADLRGDVHDVAVALDVISRRSGPCRTWRRGRRRFAPGRPA